MDKILIKGLRCSAHVGVPESERRRRQRVLLDLELGLDLRKAGRCVQIDATVYCASVAREANKIVEGRPFVLVEAMAESVAGLILKRFRVKGVTVRIRKFSVPGTRSVGVAVTRGKSRRK